MEEVYKSLDEVVSYIKNTKEYQKCISLKEKMNQNDEIKSLVEEIKKKQKEFVKNPSQEIEDQLKSLNHQLESIPIYDIYQKNLAKVNEKIDYVRDSLNDYFDDLFNM
ncbi:MAG: YlbF family regulator [Bacilli bacterium]|nr:YlbF family regulator [Bacilli bacterium]